MGLRKPFLPVRIAAGVIAAFLVAPTLVIIPLSLTSVNSLRFPPPGWSLRWYEQFLGQTMWLDAAATSIQVAVATALIATALGTLAALALVRGRFRGRAVLAACFLSPIIIPVVVIAIGMYFVFASWRLVGSPPALIAAHTVIALPFVIVNVGSTLRALDPNLELAARSLGADPAVAFRRVALPLILPSISTGALFAFVTSWDEVVIAIFLSSPLVRTLPVVMWSQVRTEVSPTLAAAATLLTIVTTSLLVLILWLRTRDERGRAR